MNTFSVATTRFEVPARYEMIRLVGTGAYGVVISAFDSETQRNVAIKKVPRAFCDLIDAKRILREIALLRQLDHENIISVVNILPPTDSEWPDVYIVSELMETDMHRIIYSKQVLTLEHVRYFVYQVLRALKYMHSADVLHRDLKPSNVLVNSNCHLKLCDLGLARPVDEDDEEDDALTEYVVTRWYRAPEIMLRCQEYSKPIDVWSTGCIFAELLERTPIFPGEDYIDQIRIICLKLGKPTVDELGFVTSEKAKRFILDLIPETSREEEEEESESPLFPFVEDFLAKDLVQRMLTFDPRRRPSVEQALDHQFMDALQNGDEPVADFKCSFDFEKLDLDRDALKALVWKEMLHYNPRLESIISPMIPPRQLPILGPAKNRRSGSHDPKIRFDLTMPHPARGYLPPHLAHQLRLIQGPPMGITPGIVSYLPPKEGPSPVLKK
ncbi:hypothetical protein CTAYLR_001691 [Chrysophaeum taylorii]|uniref:Mitogen-activated protein kinase n=1 Tax=Chrysophaeum taylorii TaxID=2483200 RepID=A0AAD7U797_9STRA|nr:hypothetical protein CTAYLR_001691 [Chrysophaeum taylorii]